MNTLLVNSTKCVSDIQRNELTDLLSIEVSIVVYDKNNIIGNIYFATDDTKETLSKILNKEWNDMYNNKDKYAILMRKTCVSHTDYIKSSTIIISDSFKNIVSINKSFILFEIYKLYKKDWKSFTITER